MKDQFLAGMCALAVTTASLAAHATNCSGSVDKLRINNDGDVHIDTDYGGYGWVCNVNSTLVEPPVASDFGNIALDISAFSPAVYDVLVIGYDYYLNASQETFPAAVTVQ